MATTTAVLLKSADADLKSPPNSSSASHLHHGGARKGAGRKPKALRFAKELAVAEQMMVAEAEPIVATLIALAKKGDVSAAKYVLDRIFGRPPEQTITLAEDLNLPLDHPRAMRAWRRREDEAAAQEFVDEATRSTLPRDALKHRVERIAAALEFELSKVPVKDASAFQTWRDSRLAEIQRIVETMPLARWRSALCQYDEQHPAFGHFNLRGVDELLLGPPVGEAVEPSTHREVAEPQLDFT